MTVKKRIFFDTIFIASASIIEKIIFFVTTIIIARYLNLNEYGEYTTALGLATFFASISNLGITGTAYRSTIIHPELGNQYYTSCLIIKCSTTVTFFVLLMSAAYIFNYNRDVLLLTLLFGFVRFATEFLTTIYALLETKQKFKISASSTVIYSILFFIGTVIVIFIKGDYFAIAIVRLAITSIFLLALMFISLTFFKIIFDKENIKNYFKETLAFTFQFIFSNIILNTSIILIPLLNQTRDAGIFQNANLFFLSISFIPLNVGRVLLPYLFQFKFSENPEKFQFAFDIYSKVFSIISIYIFICVYIYSPEIITFFFGKKYNETIPVLTIIAWAIPFTFNAASWIIIALDRQKEKAIMDGLTTVINIVFSFLLIYFYKSEGAAISAAITWGFLFVCSHYYLFKNKYIKLGTSFKIYFSLIVIAGLIIAVHRYFLKDMFFVTSLSIFTIFYFLAVLVFIISRDDLRIVNEIFRK